MRNRIVFLLIEENTFINQIRDRVKIWRDNKWPGTTEVTRKLLRYWISTEREKPLFFCQIEALETAIYLTEVAEKQGDSWSALEVDLEQIAQITGTAGAGERQRVQYTRERRAHRRALNRIHLDGEKMVKPNDE